MLTITLKLTTYQLEALQETVKIARKTVEAMPPSSERIALGLKVAAADQALS